MEITLPEKQLPGVERMVSTYNRALSMSNNEKLDVSPESIRKMIYSIEGKLKILPEHTEGDACPLIHNFGKDLYVREILMPAGFLSTTKIHKYAHPAFIMSGVVSVLEESGVKILEGPTYIMTKPGTKRIVYCHTDVVWITVHATEHTNIDDIENEIIAKDFKELEELK